MEFRLPPVQSDTDYVTVLADEDKFRIIGHITREAIEDNLLLGRQGTPEQRGEAVRSRLAEIGQLIERKYRDGSSHAYMGKFGRDPFNRLVIIRSGELKW